MPNYAVFQTPPVHEVVLSVQFGQRSTFRAFDVPKIHASFAKNFPEVSEHLPIGAITLPKLQTTDLEVEGPRARWQFSGDEQRMVQVQDDRFTFNWQKSGLAPDENYPGYSALKAEFLECLQQFLKASRDDGFGDLDVIACEVTYVNLIPLRDEDGEAIRLRNVVSFLKLPPDTPVGPLNFSWLYGLDQRENGDICKVHKTEFTTGVFENKDPVANLNMLGVMRASLDDLSSRLDELHETIHFYFQELINEELQTSWNKRDA